MTQSLRHDSPACHHDPQRVAGEHRPSSDCVTTCRRTAGHRSLLLIALMGLVAWTPISASTAEILFDGSNLEAFEFQKGGWVIDESGALTCRMQEVTDKQGRKRLRGMGYIWTKKAYSDFELTLSYKLSEAANSGVFYRTDKNNPVQGGFEIQLMDDEGLARKRGAKIPPRKGNGSFYEGQAPSSNPAKPVGEWNRMKLTCRGPIVRVELNGVEIIHVDVDDWDTPGKNPDGSPNKFKTALKDLPRTGRIGFQNHGDQVWFKEISIRRLP